MAEKKEEQWMAFVYRHPFVNSDTDEYREENRLLEEAGYQTHVVHRGRTYHETREEAEAVVKDMMQKMHALDPTIKWGGYVGLSMMESTPTFYELCQNTIMLCQKCEEAVKPRSGYPNNPICGECASEHLALATKSCALFLANRHGHYYFGCKDEAGLDTEPPYDYGPYPPISDIRTWPRNVKWPPYC